MNEPNALQQVAEVSPSALKKPLASIASNVSAMMAAQVVTFALSFALRAALGRYLGDDGYGKLTFALSSGALFSTAAGLGLSPLVAKHAARSPNLAGRYLSGSIAVRLLVGLPLYGCYCLAVTLLKSDPETRTLAYLVGFSLLISLVVTMTGAVFQAYEKMIYVSAGLIVEKIVTTTISIGLLNAGYGVIAVGWVMVVGTSANLLASVWLLRRLGEIHFNLDLTLLRPLLVASMPFFIWGTFTTIYARIDATMLSLMTNDRVTGWYGVSFTLYETLAFLPAMLKTVLLPILSRLFASDRVSFRSTCSQAFFIFSLITPPITFGTYAMARPIIGLIYPLNQFDNAVVVLQILGLGFFPLFYNILIATIVIAVDRQHYWSLAAIACAVINPAINLVLIPHYQSLIGNGGVGAAWATNAVELFLLVVGLALLPRSILAKREWLVAGKTTLAGLVMLGVIVGIPTDNLAEAVLVGTVTYVVCCLILGVASSSQLREVLALRDWTVDAASDRQRGR